MEPTPKRRQSGFDDQPKNPPKCAKTNHPDRIKKRLTHKDYTVGWVCALPIERAAAEAILDDTHECLPNSPNDSNTYTLGSIGSHNVVIACLPCDHYGVINAALVANNMTWSFPSLQTKLMVGIGGGVPGKVDIRLGDVVIGNKVLQCDFGKITSQGLCRTSTPVRPPQSLMTAVAALRARHQLEASNIPNILYNMLQKYPSMEQYSRPASEDRLFCSTYEHPMSGTRGCEGCDESKLIHRSARSDITPRLHYGAIASGNQVIKHASTRDDWSKSDDVICFEMEAAGLIDHFQCLVIRGICDYADSHKNKRWQHYAAATAAAYASELLSVLDTSRIDDTSSPTRDMESHVQQFVRPKLSSEQREAILESLRFDQIDARRQTIKRAHAKTCKWLLKKDQYLQWLDSTKFNEHRGLLWIKGKPGTGKSTLMKFAFSNAQRTNKHKNIISFFFNARGGELEQSTVGMYRSLLLQIFDMFPNQQNTLGTIGSQFTSGHQWGIESLKELFEQVIQGLRGSPVTCYIDALDECDEDQIRDMISFFESIGEESSSTGVNFSICFSSRHYPHITINHGLELILEGQEGHEQDITNYIGSKLKIGHSKLADKLRTELQDKASGVFIWVALVVEILNKEFDRGRIHALRKRLEDIPADLHELFRDILTRDNHNQNELLLCVQWVLFAREPMTPEQLYHAMLAEISTPEDVPISDEIAQEDIERFLLDASKGLAEVTKSKISTVQFIHESVRDFLLKGNGIAKIWPGLEENFEGKSHEHLKGCCIRYVGQEFEFLNSDADQSSPSSAQAEEPQEMIKIAYPFFEYAVHQLLFHANNAARHGISQEQFISTFDLDAWITLYNTLEKHPVRRYEQGVRLLYILAEANHVELIKSYPSMLPCLEMRDERFCCPLLASLFNNSHEALDVFQRGLVQELSPRQPDKIKYAFNYQKFDSDSRLSRGYKRTISSTQFAKNKPLIWYLAEDGRFDQLALLLLGSQTISVQENYRFNSDGLTLLSFLVMKGCAEIVGFLLESGEVEPDCKDKVSGLGMGRTALSHAAIMGHKEIVQLLLQTGKVDSDSKDTIGQTSLSKAAELGQKEIVQLLLETGKVDPDSKDNNGQTPLSHAIRMGYKEIVQLLLETGKVDPDSKDNNGQTPLSKAVELGQKELIQLLLQIGKVNPDTKDNNGQTPLSYAIRMGHKEIVQLLLETGNVDPDSKDNNGQTSLSKAAELGHRELIQLLLQTSQINIESRDKNGRTPLTWAASAGKLAAVKLLYETGQVNLESRDNNGRTPLSWAAGERNLAVIKFLCGTGQIDPDSPDQSGRTPLFYLLRYEFQRRGRREDVLKTIKLLLKTGRVNPGLEDVDGRSPALLASLFGKEFTEVLEAHNIETSGDSSS